MKTVIDVFYASWIILLIKFGIFHKFSDLFSTSQLFPAKMFMGSPCFI